RRTELEWEGEAWSSVRHGPCVGVPIVRLRPASVSGRWTLELPAGVLARGSRLYAESRYGRFVAARLEALLNCGFAGKAVWGGVRGCGERSRALDCAGDSPGRISQPEGSPSRRRHRV